MANRADFNVGDRVRVNNTIPESYSSEDYVGHEGVVTRIGGYIYANIEGVKHSEDPFLASELDLINEEEFWTVEELTEFKEGLEQILELYKAGFRLIKE